MGKTRNRSVLVAVGAFFLSNLKWLWGLLKFSKFGGTLISMLLSMGFYAMLYGWKFAAAFIYLIFVHEMGHLIAARRKGIKTSPAIFIPFVGAFISIKELPRDARTEAYLAYGGPLAGLISFLPAVPLYLWSKDPFWALVVFLGAFLNLFNLLPVSPLDGGRIVSVLSSKVWLIGLIILGVYMFASPSPLLFIIFLIGLFTWWNRLREGYRLRVLNYEKAGWLSFMEELQTWPNLVSFAEKRAELYADIHFPPRQEKPNRRFLLPFFHDEQRFAQDKARLDRQFAEKKWDVLVQWERTPVLFQNGNPAQPLPSPILEQAITEARQRLKQLEEEIHRLSTYYESSAKTKWKVLAAYLGLAFVLSLFLLYANDILAYHREIMEDFNR